MKRTILKTTRRGDQCHALNVAISTGVIVQANIQGMMRQLISLKSDPATGVTLLFHDEMENVCMLKVTPGKAIELVVRIEL